MKYHQRELVMRPSADAEKLRKTEERVKESSLPTLGGTLLPESRNQSRGPSRVGSRETLRSKGGGSTSHQALTQLYDPAPPPGMYSGTTSAAMTLRHSSSRGRA